VGVVQTLLAGAFVVWLLGFPETGALFAWPTTPEQTAMFIGAGFIGRTYIGYFLCRERSWLKLRWQVTADYAFLAFIWLATLWHIDEMNWTTHIWVAHVWVLAYTIEPVVLFLWEPKRPWDAWPEAWREGPVLPGLKQVAMVSLVTAVTLAGLLMINPEFMDTRWPWRLDPFNCRVMSAFFALNAGWAYTIYRSDDWAEARQAVVGIQLFAVSQFVVWLLNVRGFDPGRQNRYIYGVILAGFVIVLAYYYVRQQRARVR
jgi:hypothetical protein